MTDYTIIPATVDHARLMAPRLVLHDVAEDWVRSGLNPQDVPEFSVRRSPHAWAGMVNDDIACLFGIASESALSVSGMPWLLTTSLIYQHKMAFLRRSRPFICEALNLYPVLEGFVDPRHKLSVLWLKWLGFKFDDATSEGFKIPLHRFEMRAI